MNLAKTTRRDNTRGASLLLCLFALLLVSAVGFFMLLGSTTETRIDANYSSNLGAYYAARSGLEEVRDRVTYPSSPSALWPVPPAGGIADRLPQNIAGAPGGVLYILNPANGETVDPTDSSSAYFDDQLCHDYNSGVATGTKCTSTPATNGWNLASLPAMAPASGPPLAYKWVRLNLKTNRIASPYSVDATAPLDSLVCWDGQSEQVSPGGASPACDANGMQNVYMLTSFAIGPSLAGANARKLLRSEVVPPSIRPPGAITTSFASRPAVSFGSTGIPGAAVDGRVHNLDGTLSAPNRCSSVSALASDSGPDTRELEKALNELRKSIVTTANNSCTADGNGIDGSSCTPGLWWVRGTDPAPRFASSGTAHADSEGQMSATAHLGGSLSCDSSTPNCYLGLNLAAPELMATAATYADHIPAVSLPPNPSAPFIGNPGNQTDVSVYQPSSQNVLKDEIADLNAMVLSSVDQPNYFRVGSSSVQASYGSARSPAIVVITDTTLNLQTPLTGYGVLVVPNAMTVNNQLQWTGIVLVQSSGGQFAIGPGAAGFINGALLLQSGGGFTLQIAGSNPFRITYSCDAIDLAFQSLPFKIVASTEWTY
jgi:hypothetical protein